MMHPKVGPKVLPHQPLNPNWTKASWFISKVIDGVRHIIEQQLGANRKLTAGTLRCPKDASFSTPKHLFLEFYSGKKTTFFLMSNMNIFRYSLVTRILCRNASLRQLSSKWLTTHFSTFWCYVWKAWFFVLQFVFFVRVFPLVFSPKQT